MKTGMKVAAWWLGGMMAINAFGAAYYFVLRAQARQVRKPPVHDIETSIPSFSGVDLRGAKWDPGDAPCRVIRVTDDDCAFCKKDRSSYAALLDVARRASCEVVEFAPKSGQLKPDSRPGVIQLKFVDADVGYFLFPFGTPHTLILDGKWALKWSRRGIFDAESLAEATALLMRLASERGEEGRLDIAAAR